MCKYISPSHPPTSCGGEGVRCTARLVKTTKEIGMELVMIEEGQRGLRKAKLMR